jgi:hypothetical protein
MYQKILFPLILTLVLPPLVYGAGVQVLDRGIDGNQRLYAISCPDGSRGSITQQFTLGDNGVGDLTQTHVCIFPQKGVETCRPNWNIDQ